MKKFSILKSDWQRALYVHERGDCFLLSEEERRWQKKKWEEAVGEKEFSSTLHSMGFDAPLLMGVFDGGAENREGDAKEPEWVSRVAHFWSLGSDLGGESFLLGVEEMGTVRAAEELIWGYQVQVARDLRKIVSGIPELSSLPSIMLSRFPIQEIKKLMLQTYVLELNVARLEGRLDGHDSRERFKKFNQIQSDVEYKKSFWGEYPVLLRKIELLLHDWRGVVSEFTERLVFDAPFLREKFDIDPSCLSDVYFGAGDRHRSGRSVAVVDFGGSKLVYKPKSLKSDEIWNDVLEWVNDLSPRVALLKVKSWDRGDYGWMDHVSPRAVSSEKEAEDYYWRGGALLALLHALCATDMHYENVIACGDSPTIIDFETLFHHPYVMEEKRPEKNLIENSVINTGLLPQAVVMESDSGPYAFEMSAFGSKKGRGRFSSPVPQGVGTDEMIISQKEFQVRSPSENILKLHGGSISAADHVENMIDGFDWMYRTIMEKKDKWLGKKGILEKFSSVRMRRVVAPTFLYMDFINASWHPDYLRDALDQERLFLSLGNLARGVPGRERLVRHEMNDLRSSNVPFFESLPESRGLVASDGSFVEDFLPESGISYAASRVSGFSEKELSQQKLIIRASFAEARDVAKPELKKKRKESYGGGDSRNFSPLEAALDIARDLLDSSVQSDGCIGWLSLSPLLDGHLRYESAGMDIAYGISGIGLFFSALGARSGELWVQKVADAVSRTVLWEVDDLKKSTGNMKPGAFSGVGSLIYYLAHAGGWSEKNEWREELWDAAESLVPLVEEGVARDLENDVIEGSAGAILSLLSLHAVRPDSQALAAARSAAEKLINNAVRNNDSISWGWGGDQNHLAGFSHGASGVAYAFARLNEVSPDERYVSFIDGALNYESSCFDEEKQTWPDLRSGSDQGMMAWCHGAPGVGFARIGIMRTVANLEIKYQYLAEDLSKAENFTRSRTIGDDGHLIRADGSHVACHGISGNLEFLMAYKKIMGGRDEVLHSSLYELILEGASHAWNTGEVEEKFSPGFLSGIAGIGYEILKLSDFENIPSALLLDPPKVI
ncbi:type 2 lanthipeptide synthetase LanM family protein [Nocardiopsis alba]|uniref:type 2 lanthipeptide synthetase LanM family protein n=1 Tax=Nocardiopsis alba TaxID=53437 RepID=UPI000B1374F6|nr:type 2 lanthipeptide synthetase LanM family protein [Nocardiopsis alba]